MNGKGSEIQLLQWSILLVRGDHCVEYCEFTCSDTGSRQIDAARKERNPKTVQVKLNTYSIMCTHGYSYVKVYEIHMLHNVCVWFVVFEEYEYLYEL